jgi:hypothetical protein
MQSATTFIDAVNEYCAWAESPPRTPDIEARTALRLLVQLYGQALELNPPDEVDYDLDGADLSQEVWSSIFSRFGSLPLNHYGVVFDPCKIPAEKPVVGDLADDLADIYRDLYSGLSLERAGNHAEALHDWQLSFRNHWGDHASSAIRALHTWFANERAW